MIDTFDLKPMSIRFFTGSCTRTKFPTSRLAPLRICRNWRDYAWMITCWIAAVQFYPSLKWFVARKDPLMWPPPVSHRPKWKANRFQNLVTTIFIAVSSICQVFVLSIVFFLLFFWCVTGPAPIFKFVRYSQSSVGKTSVWIKLIFEVEQVYVG